MRILIVKLSSLGDVVHAMPTVQDIRRALPEAHIDWVVERGFADIVRRCDGVSEVIECELRRWRKQWWRASTRAAWRAFRARLIQHRYDAVLDVQGLTKSGVVSRLAALSAQGRRYALAQRTDGSSWEAPTRWLADVAVATPLHVHAIERSRVMAAQALGYALPGPLRFGLKAQGPSEPVLQAPTVALVHGTSRADKCWPEDRWQALGEKLIASGLKVVLPHGSDAEEDHSRHLAHALGPHASVWPRMGLGPLTDALGGCVGVIGVDSGLSHIAVALDLPHVQIYNFDTAWRTGPLAETLPRQCAVYAEPCPEVDAVWAAWQAAFATSAGTRIDTRPDPS